MPIVCHIFVLICMVTHKPNAMKKVIQLHQTTPQQLVHDILLGVKGEIETLKKDFRQKTGRIPDPLRSVPNVES